ncbi:MAG: hypothetical protein J6N15_00150 [Ruminiclostridium sp.]|nr:hypothetical protein [Ruminiclostridium sp.]
MLKKIFAVLTSAWLYVIAVVVLVVGAAVAVLFAPIAWRIWIGVTCGLALLVIAVRAMLMRKSKRC